MHQTRFCQLAIRSEGVPIGSVTWTPLTNSAESARLWEVEAMRVLVALLGLTCCLGWWLVSARSYSIEMPTDSTKQADSTVIRVFDTTQHQTSGATSTNAMGTWQP